MSGIKRRRCTTSCGQKGRGRSKPRSVQPLTTRWPRHRSSIEVQGKEAGKAWGATNNRAARRFLQAQGAQGAQLRGQSE